jgi:hypothetical protein
VSDDGCAPAEDESATREGRPPDLAGLRGAPRPRRGAPNAGGEGGTGEGRPPDLAGLRGAPRPRRGAPNAGGEGATGEGRPPDLANPRGAPRPRRGAPNAGGEGATGEGRPPDLAGLRGAPRPRRGAPNAGGVWGAISGPPIILISFDIDGTLEIGEPPGIVTVAMVAHAKHRGYVVGSCSDRPVSYQRRLWESLAIVPDFTVLKHRLADVKTLFQADAYYHIGDTDVDDHFASGAGFRFLRADRAAHASWGPELFGGSGKGP